MMKRLLSAVLVVVMLLTLLPAVALAAGETDATWYDASKTEFTLTTAAQLAGLAQICNADLDASPFAGKTVRLGADIDLTGYDWTPIWWNAGTFDGQGHAITGLNVTEGVDGQSERTDHSGMFGGLFAYTGKESLLCSFTVSGSVSLDKKEEDHTYYEIRAGGVVGYNHSGTIVNVGSSVDVSAKVSVKITTDPKQSDGIDGTYVYAGGIAGYSWSTSATSCILNSYANGNIYAYSNTFSYAGGIAGYTFGDPIINCYYGGSSVESVLSDEEYRPITCGIAGIAVYYPGIPCVSNCYSKIEGSYSSHDKHSGQANSDETADGTSYATADDLLTKLNDTTVRQTIITDHGVTPMAWKMGTNGMPELVFEQFTTLTVGGTYYFDLSGAGIPGDVNTGNASGAVSIPDTTLTWMPFTYAGTINAYSRKIAGQSVDTNVNPYVHSLFVSDYNATFNVTWDELDTKGFIFGITYKSGGVDYTLRAPSEGSDSSANPQTNEWTAIINKSNNYIVNHYRISSWGQDTWYDTDKRVCRGFNGIGTVFYNPTNNSNAMIGFRPVLEIPGTLASDALKPVTLNLNGGSVDGKDSLNIVVQNGAAFTAPSGKGLTRPADLSAGTYFAWTGDNGVTYLPGASVPTSVTTLTAQWVDGVVIGDFVVKGGEIYTDYEIEPDDITLYIGGKAPLTISMKPGVENTDRTISITTGVCADITLAGVNIESGKGAPLDFSDAGDSKLTLADGTVNTLTATGSNPGIYTGTGKLTIDGTGRLDVYGGPSYAGIGGSIDNTTGGTIEINNGIINAYGGAAAADHQGGGAGIGGNSNTIPNTNPNTNPGTIIINGGTIKAVGGSAADDSNRYGGAGIGGRGGNNTIDTRGFITINGGTVTAQGGTGPWGAGAGIGGSGGTSNIESITITGGVINATAGANGAAGIGGGGHNGLLINLSITGGFITATGTYKGNSSTGSDAPNNANAIGGGAGTTVGTEEGYQPDFFSNNEKVKNAVIIDGAAKTGTVYGSAVLKQAAEIPSGVTLTVPGDASLTVGTDGALTNKGLIIATGTLTRNGGTIVNSGEIRCAVIWRLTSVTHDKGDGVTYASSTDGYAATLTAAQGYTLPESVVVKAGGDVLTGGYSYDKGTGALSIDKASVTGTVEITAAGRQPFSYNYHTITATAGTGGSISPSGAIFVREELDQSFTITPDDGYVLDDVLVDGVSVKGQLTGGSYTIKNVNSGHSISVTFIEKSESTPFADVKDSDWFFEDVMYACENKLMLGTSDTAFSPNAATTRGMLVTILYRLQGEPSIEDEIWGYPFADVDTEAYYGTAVYWARLNRIVDGYGPERFGPTDAITREQLATILYRYARCMGYETGISMGMAGFDDAGKVSSYAVSAMEWACAAGLIQGSDGKLLPQGNATRGQVAAILHRFCESFAAK